jgi:hypothetical protein
MNRAQRWHRSVGATVATLSLVGVMTAGVVGTAEGAVSCGPNWNIVPSSSAVKDPRELAVVAPNDVWAVGTQPGGTAKVHPAAEHWDGSSWVLYDPPWSGTGENALNAVSAVATDDVWAVGYSQPAKKTDAAFHTLAEHWDGTSWQIVPSATVPNSGSNTLTGVAAHSAHNVWAVGYYFDSQGARKTLIEHYDGTSWSIVSSPNPGSASNSLLAVSALANDDIWAAGFTSDGLGYASLILHYDGTSWSKVSPGQDPGSEEDVLAGLSADGSSNVYAFGYHVLGSTYKTLVEHWDGSSWSVVGNTANGADNVVTILSGGSAYLGDVWAVGFDYQIVDGRYKEFTEHFDGTSWTSVPGALSSSPDKSEMYSVAHVPGTDQVWSTARSNHIELICPGTFPAVPPPITQPAPSGSVVHRTQPGLTPHPGTPYRLPGVVRPARQTVPVVAAVPIPTATDVASSAGIFQNILTHGAITKDLNNDGYPDIFLNDHLHEAWIYQNNKDGTFTKVWTFQKHDRHGCDAADVNGDGRMDIFCNTGSDRGTEAKRDELWIQTRAGGFKDKAAQYGILQPFDRGRLSTFINADNNNRPDVYAANFPDRADGMPSSNRLFINNAGTSYRLASEYGLDRELNGATLSVGDYNNDGHDDLLVNAQGGMHLFRNDGGNGFTDVTAAVGLGHRTNAAQFVDFNNDGLLDVAEVNKKALQIDIQVGGKFVPGPQVGGLQSGLKLAIGDANRDGWKDVYVEQGSTSTNANVNDVIFLNNGSGTDFATNSVAVPAPSQLGDAEDVMPIDFNKDGYTDFLVENGNSTKRGSVQLIKLRP